MSANVESMFYVRTTPWHGLGTRVEEALTSEDALHYSGLDWTVRQEPMMTETFLDVPGCKANIRNDNDAILGVVSDSYQIVQNNEAFAFTDALLGEGVRYETAGSLDGGRKVWLLARLPERYQLAGEDVDPYIVFTNTHDAPDLSNLPKNAWRVINAVSDHATHAQPLRMTKNYRENLFDKVITGHPMTDKAMKLLAAV